MVAHKCQYSCPFRFSLKGKAIAKFSFCLVIRGLSVQSPAPTVLVIVGNTLHQLPTGVGQRAWWRHCLAASPLSVRRRAVVATMWLAIPSVCECLMGGWPNVLESALRSVRGTKEKCCTSTCHLSFSCTQWKMSSAVWTPILFQKFALQFWALSKIIYYTNTWIWCSELREAMKLIISKTGVIL